MSGKKGYWIGHIHVTDPERYKLYIQGATPAYEAHGAKFVVRGGDGETVEGDTGGERHVVIEFPSYQTALDCYRSETYQAAREHRLAASEGGSLSIVEGP